MKNEKVKNKTGVFIGIASVLVVIVLWGISWSLIIHSACFKDWSERAAFGDMFGAISALFSGFAFAGIIITIYLQTKELELQRKELEDTRTEIRGQKEQLTQQTTLLINQSFEDKFFKLLSFHNQIINSIEYTQRTSYHNSNAMLILHGRKKFQEIFTELKDHYNKEKGPIEQDKINKALTKIYESYEIILGSYFRNLYYLINYVDESTIENKYFYIKLVRSQLSISELQLLFYNCLTERGNKFKYYVEKYSLFNNLPKTKLLATEHVGSYDIKAFE